MNEKPSVKHIGKLTIMSILGHGGFEGTTKGQMLVARFCDAVENGLTPDGDDLKVIAYALKAVIEGGRKPQEQLAELGRRMEISTKQGQQLSAIRKKQERVDKVADFLQDIETIISSGLCQKEAEKKARRNMEIALNLDRKTIREMIEKHRSDAIIRLKIRHMLKEIKDHEAEFVARHGRSE